MLHGIQNSDAIGYALQVADAMGLSQEQKQNIEKTMNHLLSTLR